MIANRELNLDDYLAISRRRLKVVLLPALVAAVVGLAISFAFRPKYTSSSLVLVERQQIPAGYVRPIVTAAVSDRITDLERQVLSRGELQPMVDRLGLARNGNSMDEVIARIQSNIAIGPADPSFPWFGSSSPAPLPRGSDFPGFYVSFTADDPREAQEVCGEVTSLLLAENLKSREQVALTTTDFLARQLVEAKSNLDDQDAKLATFKARYLGQLPGDVDNNFKILTGLNSQLDANTQWLNRAQQDKSYAESLLAQQISLWKSFQTSLTAQTIEQRLAALQTQLVALEARYTEEYPEVIKMKRDIAALQEKHREMGANRAKILANENTEGKGESPEILQLREQIHQNEIAIERATHEGERLQREIETYQGRLTLSPAVEEQYKQLTRDYDTALRVYNNLLANKSESEIQTDLEHRQQGEQMRLLDPANLPNSPSSPVRWRFAAYGLAAGLAFGVGIAMWLELRDKAIRNEGDVLAGLELPMLTSIPWVGSAGVPETGGVRRRFKAFLT